MARWRGGDLWVWDVSSGIFAVVSGSTEIAALLERLCCADACLLGISYVEIATRKICEADGIG